MSQITKDLAYATMLPCLPEAVVAQSCRVAAQSPATEYWEDSPAFPWHVENRAHAGHTLQKGAEAGNRAAILNILHYASEGCMQSNRIPANCYVETGRRRAQKPAAIQDYRVPSDIPQDWT